MWALNFWPDGFFPVWTDEVGADRIAFDLSFVVTPQWTLWKAKRSWRWTNVI